MGEFRLFHGLAGSMMENMISSPRLTIRRFKLSDGLDIYEMLSDPEVVAFEPYDILSWEQAEEEAARRSGDHLFYAVCLKDTGKLIGSLYLGEEDYNTRELGYVFNRRYHGWGYATESVQALLDDAFRLWGVRRITAMSSTENVKSWSLLERLGMRREGLLLQNIYFKRDRNGNPIWFDTYAYAILASEWFDLNGQ